MTPGSAVEIKQPQKALGRYNERAVSGTTSEFDRYANNYKALLHDPIREKFAPGSEFFCRRKWELLTGYLQRNGMDSRKSTWLDVGCGHGELLRMGAGDFGKVAGCDPSAEMIGACKDLDIVLQTEPARLPFSDQSFDLVTAVCVYHHVKPETRPALTAEISRVLRPGGVAGIIEHNPFNPVTQLIIHRTPVDADALLLRAGTARRLLDQAGFDRSERIYFLYFPERFYRKASKLESWLRWAPGGGQYAVFGRKPRA